MLHRSVIWWQMFTLPLPTFMMSLTPSMRKMTLLPGDPHPNEKGHKIIAETIFSVLTK